MQYRPSSKEPGHNLPANPFFVNGVSSVVFQVGFLELFAGCLDGCETSSTVLTLGQLSP